jgi:hypothetical protein
MTELLGMTVQAVNYFEIGSSMNGPVRLFADFVHPRCSPKNFTHYIRRGTPQGDLLD